MRIPPFTGVVAALLIGCSAPPPPPPAEPPPPAPEPTQAAPQEIPKEPIDSGQACLKAEAQCAGGVCVVGLTSACQQPVTCSLLILTVCQAETDLVQVKSRARGTFPAGGKAEMATEAPCSRGTVVSTRVETLECK